MRDRDESGAFLELPFLVGRDPLQQGIDGDQPNRDGHSDAEPVGSGEKRDSDVDHRLSRTSVSRTRQRRVKKNLPCSGTSSRTGPATRSAGHSSRFIEAQAILDVGVAVVLISALLSSACRNAPVEERSQRSPAPRTGIPAPTIDCKQIQCFRAVTCVTKCGDEPQSFGCCPCPAGMVDELTCR